MLEVSWFPDVCKTVGEALLCTFHRNDTDALGRCGLAGNVATLLQLRLANRDHMLAFQHSHHELKLAGLQQTLVHSKKCVHLPVVMQ